jgi:hypothetical protein
MVETPSLKPLPRSTLQALKEQATPELMERLVRYAQTRARMVCRAGRPVSETYAEELVHDAHADTRLGLLPWDPFQCERLEEHLGRAIKKRTWKEIRHGLRVPFVALHEAANDETVSPHVERALANASQSECNPIMLDSMATTACRQLRLLLPLDHEIAAVMRCWEDGIVERDEVMKLTGLTAAAYKRARRRLRYMSRHLPFELREAAQDLLRCAA